MRQWVAVDEFREMRLLSGLLVLNMLVILLVWWQLFALRQDIHLVVSNVESVVDVANGVRVSGSLFEKASLAKRALRGIKSKWSQFSR